MAKKIYYLGILGIVLFEIANVYFIMPMPGSQEMNSIDLAYFLYSWRWIFRLVFILMLLYGFKAAFQKSKILSLIFFVIAIGIGYATNYVMAADSMFLQTHNLKMSDASKSKINTSRIVIGITYKGESRAYPIQFLGYHHQVFDTIAQHPILVTYCTVCRSGRVFEPIVNGTKETFRLVGMDHFNAMFEDQTTKSWWRQATGEAIAGTLKGQSLPELPSRQMSLKQWLALNPKSLIMQMDKGFKTEYDSLSNYESGRRKGNLTRRDTLSWKDKSWIVGITVDNQSKAYDWNDFVKKRIIYDVINNKPIVLILANDNTSFIAFERSSKEQKFNLTNTVLNDGQNEYTFLGQSRNPLIRDLKPIKAYQEYWHSWKTFHPFTLK
ncbi:DUF3179 domain-containing (seleno)protein [Flavobacterium taihuense]|uniref:DUF3179 domain-containing protein n=1 Tax=Flavobacterium taihuense TaxID=2857508 RepID=A0ABS6XUN3_9FLAO|nr:DUF3179 domain-containing (seleno)protein [Flavobacterium taihuense]MBW4359971.1 DUF3179 domain-containing protein [Flavobacterium taihuense]